MRKIILCFLFLLPCLLSAQATHVVVEGKVTDILHKPIAFATIQNIGTDEGANANASGHYIFKTTLPATLKASYLGYKTVLKKILPEAGKDTLQIDFALAVDSAQLQQVVVTATNEPELVKESGDLIDFETNQHKVWLLYDYRKGDHLEVYDTAMKYLTRITLKHHSGNLTKTPYNYLYIENADSVRLFDYDVTDKSIDVGLIPLNEMHRFVKNLITYNSPNYYYLWTGADSSTVCYWYFNSLSQKRKIVYFYRNQVLARQNDSVLHDIYLYTGALYDEQGMPVAMAETGGSGESVYADAHPKAAPRDSRYYQDSLQLVKSLYTSIYSPLRIVRDSIYIFNFDNDSIYVFNFNNTLIRQMPLTFQAHGYRYNSQDVLVTEEGTECYFKFNVGGKVYLEKIDLNNGSKMNTQKLEFAFPEKIRIMAGYAYYTYSDAEDNAMFVRHLYRQKIN